MAGDNQDLTLTIKANTTNAQQGMDGLNASFGRLTGAFVAGGLITNGLQRAFGFLEGVVSDSVKAFNESERVQAQMNATLESTQHAAGLSAQQLLNLSQELQRTTTFSDEAVLSVENLLLTFTNITGDQFSSATTAVLDMATALGQDASSAAIQLGKALNDPIQGISALSRVGVNFSNAQKEVIAQMVKTGDTIGAQKLILAELSKEFGGSATAAAKTFEGQMKQVANKIDDIQEGIGHGLVAALDAAFIAFNNTSNAMGTTVDLGKTVFRIFSFITEAAADVAVGIHWIAAAIVDLGSVIVQATGVLQLFGIATDESFSNFRGAVNDGAKATTEFALNLHDENQKMLADWDNLTTDSKKYATTGPAAYQATAAAAKEASDKIKAVNKDIADTALKLADLIEAREQQVADTRKSVGEEYVAQENRITQLKIDLSQATDAAERNRLAAELQQNVTALQSKAQLEKDYQAEITEARRRASETEFERNLEDIERRAIADTKAFEKKRNQIYGEMALNDQKRLALVGNEQTITQVAVSESAKRTASVTASVDAQVAQYARVEAAARAAYSVSASASVSGSGGFVNPNAGLFGTGGITTSAVKRESGGMVPGMRGEAVPIIAHGGEEVIPAEYAGRRSNAGTFIVQIYNPTVRNDNDLYAMERMLDDKLRPLLENAKIQYS